MKQLLRFTGVMAFCCLAAATLLTGCNPLKGKESITGNTTEKVKIEEPKTGEPKTEGPRTESPQSENSKSENSKSEKIEEAKDKAEKIVPECPFPQHVSYTEGTIRPNVSQEEMDNVTRSFYEVWKENYVLQNPYTEEVQYYVWYSGKRYRASNPVQSVAVTVSEAHGYGMMITALMAGYDDNAKTVFDGMYQYYTDHLSSIGPHLMAWQQSDNGNALIDGAENGSLEEGDSDSATDGDLDIAYALLLADKQWGSKGKVNYRKAADDILADIMKYEVNTKDWTLQLGDWASYSPYDSDYYTGTRSSDFLPDHLKVFYRATGEEGWNNITDQIYNIIGQILEKDSKDTGLLPDFIIKDKENGGYRPAYANFLESDNDGGYGYNACRVPWRIGMDYLVTGDKREKEMLDKLNRWIRKESQNNPDNIKAGYTLMGKATQNYEDLCFTAPYLVAAMCQEEGEGAHEWLDLLWNKCSAATKENYYNDSIKMLCLMVASGNWWVPE